MTSFLSNIFGKGPEVELPDHIQRQKSLKKRLNLGGSYLDTDFVAFDTELTGLDFKKDSIISIGAVKLKGGIIFPSNSIYRMVKPESELNHKSVVVHEITHSDLDEAEDLDRVIDDFVKFIGDAVLIGHFIHIDLNFVNKVLKKKYGIALSNRAVDTSTLHDWLYENDSRFARHHEGMTDKTDLFSLAQKYGVPAEKAHNSFYDAYITAQLFQRFITFLPDCGIKTVKDLLAVSRP